MHNAACFFAFVSKQNFPFLGGAGTLLCYQSIKQDPLPAEQRRSVLASFESLSSGIHCCCMEPCCMQNEELLVDLLNVPGAHRALVFWVPWTG